MATTDEELKQIVFNKLSKEKYEELKAAGELNSNEFYITPDESVSQDDFEAALALKADAETTYTKEEVDTLIANAELDSYLKIADAETTYATKTELSNEVSTLNSSIETINTTLATKADSATTLAGYGIEDAYTKTEVDSALALKANSADVYTKEEVDAKVTAVYRYKGTVDSYESLPSEDLTVGDVYNVEDTGANYAWTGTEWDNLGATIDLTPYLTSASAAETYATKTELSTEVSTINSSISTINSSIDTINSTLETKADKTEIPTAVSELENDSGYVTATELEAKDYATNTALSEGLATKQDTLTFDDVPTADSENVVKSGGVYSAIADAKTELQASIDTKANASDVYTKTEVDTAIEDRVVAVIRTWTDDE